MKTVLIKLLALFGLAPARVVASQAQLIQELKTDSFAWKRKAGEALALARSFERQLEDQKKQIDRARAAAEKNEMRQTEVQKLKDRLGSTERELAVAREHLMAVEVKLDILEGAANVLDVRTRTVLRRQPDESGAPV